MDSIEKISTVLDFSSTKNSLKKAIRTLAGSKPFRAEDRFVRIEQPIHRVDPLKWLRQQKADTKIYWSERDGKHVMAGIGCAALITASRKEEYSAIFNEMRSSLNPDHKLMRYYGGFRFNPNEEPDLIWENFGTFRFIMPLIEIIREDGETRLAVNLKSDSQLNFVENSIPKLIDKIEYNPDFEFETGAVLKSRIDTPNKQGWYRNIAEAKRLFQDEKLAKIVLARRAMLEFTGRIDAIQLIDRLKSTGMKNFGFYLQPTENSAFFGGSPELLYYREKNKIFSEAVAGTRPRGETQEIDKEMADELLNSSKDVQEHRFVCQHIEEALRDFCSSFVSDDDVGILKSEMVQHLCKKYEGTLKDSSSDAKIISRLHPTPAVGLRFNGNKEYVEQALNKIREIEQFDRGWYAGPVGWVGVDSAEFAVGIRSGMVQQNKLYLFSGAGIVPDSNAEQEWTEIEQKISQYLRFLQN